MHVENFSKGNFGCIQSLLQWSPAYKNKQKQNKKQVKEEDSVTLRPGSAQPARIRQAGSAERSLVHAPGLGWPSKQAEGAEGPLCCLRDSLRKGWTGFLLQGCYTD